MVVRVVRDCRKFASPKGIVLKNSGTVQRIGVWSTNIGLCQHRRWREGCLYLVCLLLDLIDCGVSESGMVTGRECRMYTCIVDVIILSMGSNSSSFLTTLPGRGTGLSVVSIERGLMWDRRPEASQSCSLDCCTLPAKQAGERTRFEQIDLDLAVSVRSRHTYRRPDLAGEAVGRRLRPSSVESFHASQHTVSI